MKANLKKFLGLAALGMSLLTNTAPTWAGFQYRPEVLIVDGGPNGLSYAFGSMVGARYSVDHTQYIGCYSFITPSYSDTFCSATDKTGKYLYCGSSDPRWAEEVQALTDSSLIRFELKRGNNGGDCGVIQVWNNSHLLK